MNGKLMRRRVTSNGCMTNGPWPGEYYLASEADEEIRRLREALKFYASEGAYENDQIEVHGSPTEVPFSASIIEDRGYAARRALDKQEGK